MLCRSILCNLWYCLACITRGSATASVQCIYVSKLTPMLMSILCQSINLCIIVTGLLHLSREENSKLVPELTQQESLQATLQPMPGFIMLRPISLSLFNYVHKWCK